MPPVPQKYQVLAVLQLVVGVCNVFFGWFVSSMVVSVVAGTCTSIFLCPLGFLCGMVPWLILPVGMAEITFGLLMLVAPDTVKGFVGWVPFLQLPTLLVGDFLSPIVAIVGLALTRDVEVAGFIEGL